jgi:hypothetical protein
MMSPRAMRRDVIPVQSTIIGPKFSEGLLRALARAWENGGTRRSQLPG